MPLLLQSSLITVVHYLVIDCSPTFVTCLGSGEFLYPDKSIWCLWELRFQCFFLFLFPTPLMTKVLRDTWCDIHIFFMLWVRFKVWFEARRSKGPLFFTHLLCSKATLSACCCFLVRRAALRSAWLRFVAIESKTGRTAALNRPLTVAKLKLIKLIPVSGLKQVIVC